MPTEDSSDQEDKASKAPSIAAGIIRSITQNVIQALAIFSKSLLKFWFRFPIKLFRPQTVNPWAFYTLLANSQGQDRLTLGYFRSIVKSDGLSVMSRNLLPLLTANAIVGICLFNTYTTCLHRLSVNHSDKTINHFIAGSIAGLTQSVLSVPLDNVQRSINPSDLVKERNIPRVVFYTLQRVLPPIDSISHFSKHFSKFLYRGFFATAAKETASFSAFFGTFELVKKIGKRSVKENLHQDLVPFANGLAVVCAGGMAGASYHFFSYPFQRTRDIISRRRGGVARVLRKSGFKIFSGFGGTVVRVMPASAVGLFVFEVLSHSIDF